MIRPLLAAAGLGLLAAAATAQQARPDRVHFRGPDGKPVVVVGECKESPTGVTVTGADKKERKVAPADMVRIDYGDGNVPGIDNNQMLVAIAAEGNPDPAKSLDAATVLLKSATSPKAKRYAGFRELMLAVKVNDQKTGDDFKKDAPTLAARCVKFATEQKGSWECWPAARTAMRISSEVGDAKAATAAARTLSGNTNYAGDLKAEAKLLELAAALREGDYAGVRLVAAEAAGVAANPGQTDRAKMYEAAIKVLPAPKGEGVAKPVEAVAAIEKLINDSKEPVARACGYAVLGELYLAYGATRDATWAYLNVDVVYNQDRDEQARAVARLVEIFTLANNKEQADLFADKLPRVRP